MLCGEKCQCENDFLHSADDPGAAINLWCPAIVKMRRLCHTRADLRGARQVHVKSRGRPAESRVITSNQSSGTGVRPGVVIEFA